MKTMTKKSVLKLAMTVVATFMFTAVMGQDNNTGATQWEAADQAEIGDYVRSNPTPINSPDVVIYNDLITVGTTMPFWVWPSAVYNPDFNYNLINVNYVEQSAIETGVLSSFAWKVGAYDSDEGTTITAFDGITAIGGFEKNYVEIEFNATGQRLIQVIESPAVGPCPAEAVWFGLTVIDVPTAEVSGGSSLNSWDEIVAGHEYAICGDAAAEDLLISISEPGVTAAMAHYAYSVRKRVVNIDELDDEIPASEATDNEFVNHTIESKYHANLVDGGLQTVSTGLMPVVNGQRTKYEFTLRTATDYPGADGEGIVSAISQKSDYLALAADTDDISTYDFTGTLTVTYIVNPTPVTGPIYHIPNNFGL